MECVLFTPLNEVSVIRGLVCVLGIEWNTTGQPDKSQTEEQTELIIPLPTLGSLKELEREFLVSFQPHAFSKLHSHLQASSLKTP